MATNLEATERLDKALADMEAFKPKEHSPPPMSVEDRLRSQRDRLATFIVRSAAPSPKITACRRCVPEQGYGSFLCAYHLAHAINEGAV